MKKTISIKQVIKQHKQLMFNLKNTNMFDFMNERNKTKSKLHTDSFIGCYSIDKKRPSDNQPILYVGNHGLTEGTYREYSNGVGWVLLPSGGVDCFDEWKPKIQTCYKSREPCKYNCKGLCKDS